MTANHRRLGPWNFLSEYNNFPMNSFCCVQVSINKILKSATQNLRNFYNKIIMNLFIGWLRNYSNNHNNNNIDKPLRYPKIPLQASRPISYGFIARVILNSKFWMKNHVHLISKWITNNYKQYEVHCAQYRNTVWLIIAKSNISMISHRNRNRKSFDIMRNVQVWN